MCHFDPWATDDYSLYRGTSWQTTGLRPGDSVDQIQAPGLVLAGGLVVAIRQAKGGGLTEMGRDEGVRGLLGGGHDYGEQKSYRS